MFGKNEIVGQRYFKEAPDDTLFVTSIFYTLQGEGPYAGLPAVFVRLAKCNLNCSFCDTFFDDGDWLTNEEIFERAQNQIDQFYRDQGTDKPDFANLGVKQNGIILVMTGGEPLLQKNIGPFLHQAQHLFQSTQIESNGMIHQDIPESTTLVISPKCSEKTGKYFKIHKNNVERVDALKFVISAEDESPYNDIPDWAKELGKSRELPVYVSPMNIYNDVPAASKQQRAKSNKIDIEERSTVDEVISFWEPGLLDMDANQINHEYTARLCMKHGYRLNLQTHLYASLA